MSVRTWHYLLDDDGVHRRLTQKAVANLRERGGTMPDHASQRRKIIVGELDANGQKPPMLLHALGRYWVFDERGSLFKQLLQEQKDVVDLFPGSYARQPGGAPYDEAGDQARRDDLRKEIIERTTWTPTDEDMEPIVRDIWHMPLASWRTLNLEVPAARH